MDLNLYCITHNLSAALEAGTGLFHHVLSDGLS